MRQSNSHPSACPTTAQGRKGPGLREEWGTDSPEGQGLLPEEGTPETDVGVNEETEGAREACAAEGTAHAKPWMRGS